MSQSLSDSITIGSLRLPNRLVRSATWEGLCAADGRPTERLLWSWLQRGGDLLRGRPGRSREPVDPNVRNWLKQTEWGQAVPLRHRRHGIQPPKGSSRHGLARIRPRRQS